MKKIIFLLSFSLFIAACQNKSKEVSNNNQQAVTHAEAFEVFDASIPKDVEKYKSYGLDATCPNLLDPRIGKEEINEINAAWMDLNQAIGRHLAEQNFDWESETPKIRIWHKFYFHKDGSLNKYFFNFTGNAISEQKRAEYKILMQEFGKSYQLPLAKDSAFAQCGKGAFMNTQ